MAGVAFCHPQTHESVTERDWGGSHQRRAAGARIISLRAPSSRERHLNSANYFAGHPAKQLKGIEKHPLVVVLANPYNSWVPLEGGMFLGALFGDPQFSFTSDGTGRFYSGRNGRLHVTEMDGSVHGNHPYLSAVAVLRFIYRAEAWAEAMSKARAAGYVELLPGMREMTRIVMSMGEDAVENLCLDVYETVSESAIPLPRDFFAGPGDTRWGVVAPGKYWQVAGPVG